MVIQYFVQTVRSIILANIQVKMKYGILYPVFLQLLNSQTGKQLLLPLKISLEGRDEQTLSKTARTAEEVVTACLYQLINQSRFINVEISLFTDFLEVLYSDRIDFVAHILTLYDDLYIITKTKVQKTMSHTLKWLLKIKSGILSQPLHAN